MSLNTIPFINYEIPKSTGYIYYRLGYKFKYIPYILVEDIANVMSHWKLTGNSGGFIGGNRGFNSKYREFLYSIQFNLYKETAPYHMAVEIIKDLSSKYDFRQIEKAIISQNENFEFIESSDMFNPLIDLDILDDNIKELLQINKEHQIPINIINILQETEKFDKLFSNINSVEFAKMRAYNQIKNIPKYKLVLPMFKYNFPLKNYNIKQGAPRDIVIFRDISKSAEVLEPTFKGLLLHFIQTYKGKNIIIHEFTDYIINTYTLKSIDDIKKYYNKNIRYYISYLKFNKSFITEYSECFIVSSGVTDIYPRMLNCIVNGISKGGNETLKLLCSNTKGKYIAI